MISKRACVCLKNILDQFLLQVKLYLSQQINNNKISKFTFRKVCHGPQFVRGLKTYSGLTLLSNIQIYPRSLVSWFTWVWFRLPELYSTSLPGLGSFILVSRYTWYRFRFRYTGFLFPGTPGIDPEYIYFHNQLYISGNDVYEQIS